MTQVKDRVGNRLQVGDTVKSRYRTPWTGIILYIGEGWVDTNGNKIERWDLEYVEGKDYKVKGNHNIRLEYSPHDKCCVIKLVKDRHGFPYKRNYYTTIDSAWLEKE